MPRCTIGFAVSDPYAGRPAAAFPVSLNVQARASLDTFADEIVDPVASRVFARLALGYAHDPELVAVDAAAFVVRVRQAGLALAFPFPPHAATSTTAAATSAVPSAMRVARAITIA